MKKLKFLLICCFAFFIASCDMNFGGTTPKDDDDEEKDKITYTITFVDGDNKVLKTVEVEEGATIEEPTFDAPEGYYYLANFYETELENIKKDKTLKYLLREYYKVLEFYKDNKLYKTLSYQYHSEPETLPTVSGEYIESYSWVKGELTFNGEEYIQRYDLEYTEKQEFNITYYDGENVLNLAPAKYNNTEDTILPAPQKEGYEFIGWFLSDISLALYDKIPEGNKGDIVLYAKYLETVSHNTYSLPEASLHFTSVVYSQDNPTLSVWRPVIPASAPSQSVLDYDWTTSDKQVAVISAYASVAISSGGFCVITATLKSDPTYTINAMFRADANGLYISSVEEANTPNLVTVTFKGKNGETIGTQKVRSGSFAYLPTPPTYEGYSFAGWDHDNWNITTNTTFTALYTTDYENPYVGKTIAFVGDSLTSYHGFIPHGYDSFLPNPTSDTFDVNQTWWMQVTNALGAKMFVNNSYGGTCVYGGTEPTNSDQRLSHLKIGTQTPDVIIIYMGSNDCAASESYPGTYNVNVFATAYQQMLDKIQALCPDSEIIIVTLAQSKMFSSNSVAIYDNTLKSIAAKYNLKLVDLQGLDNTKPKDGVALIVDAGHPSKAGNDEIAKYFLEQFFE